jgi:hypothetical protein
MTEHSSGGLTPAEIVTATGGPWCGPNPDAQNGMYRFAVVEWRDCTMPRWVHSTPMYRLHRRSGQAVVTLNGKDHYLGRWNSRASKDAYDRLVSEWLVSNRQPLAEEAESDFSVTELVAR